MGTTDNQKNTGFMPASRSGDSLDLPDGYRMTELGPLPEEWRVVRLGEVTHVDWGNTTLTKKFTKSWISSI